jgi:EmrB/QacA subfamily drug resistance transporter
MLSKLEYKYIVALVGVFSIFMELLDTTIINVAIPDLAKEFDVTSASTIGWVITGYLLSLAVFIPISGWAGDRFGTKYVFMFAVTVFSASSMMCALAWNIEALIGFRVMQGVGGGMLSPVAFSMVWRAFPPEERSKAAGIMVVPAAVAPASGPVVGGLLLKYASWHWIFLVNIPIGIAALTVSALYLRNEKQEAPGRFDPAGFVLGGAGLASVVYSLAEAGNSSFTDAKVIGFGIAGLAILAAFALVELRSEHPMLDIRILANPLFRACNLAWIVTMLGGSSMIFLLTLELQAARGLSALESGLTTFVMAIGVMAAAQPASRIYNYVGPRRMILGGLIVCALATLALARTDLEVSLWELRALMIARGLGFGFVLVPLQAATYAQISGPQTGRATALYNATSQVASSLGVAIAASYLTSRLTHYGAQLGNPATRDGSLSAFQDGFMLMGVLSLIGVGVAFLIRDRDAASTMHRGAVIGGVEGEHERAVAMH